jgi:predicted nucleic acid-binding protein
VSVVIDASGLAAFLTHEREGAAVAAWVASWERSGRTVHAPELARYEVANVLTRLAVSGQLDAHDVREAWSVLQALRIAFHPLDGGPSTVALALRLERRSAWDASYLALAESLGAELFTLDGSLARNVRQRGLPVRSLLERPPDPPDE